MSSSSKSTYTGPWWTATRTSSASPAIEVVTGERSRTARTSASPARTARSASFSCATGKPKIDSVPSPLSWTMCPSKRVSMTSRHAAR